MTGLAPAHALVDERLQVDALDGLRGIAVTLVVLSHVSNVGAHLLPGLDLGGIGKAGVFLFFVLSAFLLTRSLLLRAPGELRSGRLWANYTLRRCLRIFPLFTLVVLVSWLGTLASAWLGSPIPAALVPFDLDAAGAWQHLTLRAGESVLWSIPVEFKYYGVLPIAALLLAALRRHLVAATLATAAALAAVALRWPAAASDINTIRLGPYLPLFLLGSYAAFLHQWLLARPDGPWLRRGAEAVAWLAAAGVILTFPLVYQAVIDPDSAASHFHRSFALYGALWSAFLLGTLHGTGGWRAVLRWPPLRYLGFISFGVYLWHLGARDTVRQLLPLPDALDGVATLGLAVAIASATYIAVERPCMRVRITEARWQRLRCRARSLIGAHAEAPHEPTPSRHDEQ
jgi:peptidoglycan/LPS O-acetylase OafA/YrhL